MSEFLAITLLITLAAISPGPDFAMVVKNSLLYSRKGGIATSLGISCSMLIHASYSIIGLAIIISHSLLLFSIIKYLGAAYLTYIGIKALLAKNTLEELAVNTSAKKISLFQLFRQGLLCNILNPKAIMFFVALFTMVIKPGTSFVIQSAYALEIAAIHLIWFSALSFFLTHHKVSKRLRKIQLIITKIMGGLLVTFGIRIATLIPH